MKRALIGGFFFLGGVWLLAAEAVNYNQGQVALLGIVFGLFGGGLMLYELFKKEKKD
ncbi:MAG: hypothetical protein FWG31_08705 [Oscillospiraceae bacterium]|nr:hypothetical protein [Oscillospiraceae bacterium]